MIISDLEHLEVFTPESNLVGGTGLDGLVSLLNYRFRDSIRAFLSLPGINDTVYAADEVTPTCYSVSATDTLSLVAGGIASVSYSSQSSVA